mgnify:FL=1
MTSPQFFRIWKTFLTLPLSIDFLSRIKQVNGEGITTVNLYNSSKIGVRYLLVLVFLGVLSNCNYKGSSNSDIQGKAILNFQRGLNTKSVGISVSCDTDTPSVATKKITGNVKDFNTLANIANARVSTNPSYATVTLSDASGNFSISGIDSTVTELTMGVTATGYDTLSQKIRLTCQNSIVTILINAVTLSAAGVNSFIMDTSTLDNANIQ